MNQKRRNWDTRSENSEELYSVNYLINMGLLGFRVYREREIITSGELQFTRFSRACQKPPKQRQARKRHTLRCTHQNS